MNEKKHERTNTTKGQTHGKTKTRKDKNTLVRVCPCLSVCLWVWVCLCLSVNNHVGKHCFHNKTLQPQHRQRNQVHANVALHSDGEDGRKSREEVPSFQTAST